MFRYHKEGSKKLNACNWFFLCMVYFSPKHKALLCTDHKLQCYIRNMVPHQPCPLLLNTRSLYLTPLFSNLENQLFLLVVEYQSTLVHGLLTTVHPLLLHPPRHTPQIKLQYLHRQHQQHQPSRLIQYVYDQQIPPSPYPYPSCIARNRSWLFVIFPSPKIIL